MPFKKLILRIVKTIYLKTDTWAKPKKCWDCRYFCGGARGIIYVGDDILQSGYYIDVTEDELNRWLEDNHGDCNVCVRCQKFIHGYDDVCKNISRIVALCVRSIR